MKKIFEKIQNILQRPVFLALVAFGLAYLLYRQFVDLKFWLDAISISGVSILYIISSKSAIDKKFILKFSIFYSLFFIIIFFINASVAIYSIHNLHLVISEMHNILDVFYMTLIESLFRFILSFTILWLLYSLIYFKEFFSILYKLVKSINKPIKAILTKLLTFFKSSKILAVILTVGIIFILFNAFIFSSIVRRESKGNINKEARTYLASAYAINNLYIFPLSNTFGFLSPVTKPFYIVRNFLYNKGIDKLAPADGEREWWWGRIIEQEFVELYMQAMFDWTQYNVLPRKKANELLRMENEVYTHLLNIPNANPYDKSLKKEKYLMFIETGYRYATYFSYLPHKFQRDYKIDYTDRQIRHFEKVYDTYLKYKDFALKNEKDSIQFVPNNNKLAMREPEFISQLLRALLSSLDEKNNLSCNCEYLQILTDTQSDILDYLIKNSNKINYDYILDLDLQTTPFNYSNETKIRCQDSRDFKSYKKFLDRKDKYLNGKTKKGIK